MVNKKIAVFSVLVILIALGLTQLDSIVDPDNETEIRIIQNVTKDILQPLIDKEVENVIGTEDKTVIRRETVKETDDSYIFTISIVSRDNNVEGDGNGGKIQFINAQVIDVIKEDWEENCRTNNDFSYECYKLTDGNKTFQWFNFVFGNEDKLKLIVKTPKQEASSINILETGGMECGAYFQTSQTGPYRGFPDGSGGLPCSAEKTFLGNKKISDFVGFPVISPLVAYAQEEITIPVKVHLVKSSQLYTSERSEDNIRNLFSKVNFLWSQAKIKFEISEILTTNIESSILDASVIGNPTGLINVNNYDKNVINAFFLNYLGANGIAFNEQKIILVADETTVYDFRATSHELGHLLGLSHVNPVNMLMARGVNGFILTNTEIENARQNAVGLIS